MAKSLSGWAVKDGRKCRIILLMWTIVLRGLERKTEGFLGRFGFRVLG